FAEINELLARLVWVLTVGTGLFVALGMLGLDKTVTSLVAGAGILTLVAGLAFQDLASNFIAGILLQLRHPFRTGHLIRTNEGHSRAHQPPPDPGAHASGAARRDPEQGGFPEDAAELQSFRQQAGGPVGG